MVENDWNVGFTLHLDASPAIPQCRNQAVLVHTVPPFGGARPLNPAMLRHLLLFSTALKPCILHCPCTRAVSAAGLMSDCI